MTSDFSTFTAKLREFIRNSERGTPNAEDRALFDALALELFALQFEHNEPYRRLCERRGVPVKTVSNWREIPAVPTVAFKELELSCLRPQERTTVFHSSGTTKQKPSCHFHNAESLAIYEASLLPWFEAHVLRSADGPSASSAGSQLSSPTRWRAGRAPMVILTPPSVQAPHSSLVYMFETARQQFGSSESLFVGKLASDGAWNLDLNAALVALSKSIETNQSVVLLGTAFSFVHLLDYLAPKNLSFKLPAGSRVMETGGYKGRSRNLRRTELHTFITQRLGIPPMHIVCEYGMSELSSQAYDGGEVQSPESRVQSRPGVFRFPPWARAQIISPETGREVSEGERGLIRVFDLANVFSVMAIQTEDLGIRRGDEFELIGRVARAEPRGCSLMTV